MQKMETQSIKKISFDNWKLFFIHFIPPFLTYYLSYKLTIILLFTSI